MRALLIALVAYLLAVPPAAGRTADVAVSFAAYSVGSGERVAGSGRVIEDRRAVPPFTAVHVTGPFDIELKASDRDMVVVRIDDNLAAMVETRVVEGDRATLEIGVRPDASFRTARAPVVVVEFRALSELVVRGAGDVRADAIRADDFALSMSGSGDARIASLTARRFAAVLAGSGTLVVGGRADEQAYRVTGSGDVDAGRLAGRRVQVAVAGSGDISVNATETLDATISGSGDLTYRGSPRITQRIRGSGTVRRAD